MRRINPINCLVKSQLFEIEFSTVRGCFEWPWRTPICIRSSTESLSIDYGGRTKRGWQTGHIEPARANASPSRSTAKGDEKVSHKTYTQEEYKYLIRYTLGLSKPTGNVGQHAKNNSEGDWSQFRWLWMRFVLHVYIFICYLQDSMTQFLNFDSTYKNSGAIKYYLWRMRNHEKTVPMYWTLEQI